MPILLDVLKPSVVTKIVSRIRTPRNVLSRRWGMQIGGPAVDQFTMPNINQYTYDIFDSVRTIARFRNPNVAAGTIAPNPVGNNTVTFARVHEKLPMDYGTIAGIRTIGENAGSMDRVGKRYVEKQAKYMRERQENAREFMIGSLFRGGLYYLHQSGDDLYPSYTSTSALLTVDLKFDTQHKLIAGSFAAGLAMNTGTNTITATWATASTDIPLQLQAVSAGFEREVGEPLTNIDCNYTVWNNVVQNDKVRQLAGTANTSFEMWKLEDDKGEDGTRTGVQQARIKGLDWLTWTIYSGGLDVYDGSTETFTKLIPDDYALFYIEHDQSPTGWIKMVEGTEIIKENDWSPPREVTGFEAWIMEKSDPARFDMFTLCKPTLELNVPKAIAIARVQ